MVPYSQISNMRKIHFWQSQCLKVGPAVHVRKNDGIATQRKCVYKIS